MKNLGTGREPERKTKHLRPHSHVIMIVLNHTPLSSLQNIINYPYSLTERALEIQRGGGVLLRNLLGIPWRRGGHKTANPFMGKHLNWKCYCKLNINININFLLFSKYNVRSILFLHVLYVSVNFKHNRLHST